MSFETRHACCLDKTRENRGIMNSFRMALAILTLITLSFLNVARADILFDTGTLSYMASYEKYLSAPELFGQSIYDYQTSDKFLYMASFYRPDVSAFATEEMPNAFPTETLFPYQAEVDEANKTWMVNSAQ